jgi:hypothetical protein
MEGIRDPGTSGVASQPDTGAIFAWLPFTCMYSMGVSSPESRLTETLLAGKALGDIVCVVRLRAFAMVRELMETVGGLGQHDRCESGEQKGGMHRFWSL